MPFFFNNIVACVGRSTTDTNLKRVPLPPLRTAPWTIKKIYSTSLRQSTITQHLYNTTTKIVHQPMIHNFLPRTVTMRAGSPPLLHNSCHLPLPINLEYRLIMATTWDKIYLWAFFTHKFGTPTYSRLPCMTTVSSRAHILYIYFSASPPTTLLPPEFPRTTALQSCTTLSCTKSAFSFSL